MRSLYWRERICKYGCVSSGCDGDRIRSNGDGKVKTTS